MTLAQTCEKVGTQIQDQLVEELAGQLCGLLAPRVIARAKDSKSTPTDPAIDPRRGDLLLSQLAVQFNTLPGGNVSPAERVLAAVVAKPKKTTTLGRLDEGVGSSLAAGSVTKIYEQLVTQVDEQLGGSPRAATGTRPVFQLESMSPEELTKKIQDQPRYLSVWWAAWAGYYEGGAELGVQFDQEQLKMFTDWCRAIPFVVAYSGVVFVSRNPVHIHWQEGLLHNDAGPSVEYRDGWSLWTLGGLPVDEQIVMRPETQTIEQINAEENADIRSVRIERFGWPRYLKESEATCIDSRDNAIDGTLEALYKTGNDETRLVATDPSGKVVDMGVPATITNCEEAQKWIHRGRVMLART